MPIYVGLSFPLILEKKFLKQSIKLKTTHYLSELFRDTFFTCNNFDLSHTYCKDHSELIETRWHHFLKITFIFQSTYKFFPESKYVITHDYFLRLVYLWKSLLKYTFSVLQSIYLSLFLFDRVVLVNSVAKSWFIFVQNFKCKAKTKTPSSHFNNKLITAEDRDNTRRFKKRFLFALSVICYGI